MAALVQPEHDVAEGNSVMRKYRGLAGSAARAHAAGAVKGACLRRGTTKDANRLPVSRTETSAVPDTQ